MPRVHHVKKARKSYKSDGIKRGDNYYWWKFNYGPKIRSKVAPKPSQLTRSEFLSAVYDIQDELRRVETQDELIDIADRIRELASEQEDKISNMPDSLQQSPVAELLQNRAHELNTWADDLSELTDEEIQDGMVSDYQGE